VPPKHLLEGLIDATGFSTKGASYISPGREAWVPVLAKSRAESPIYVGRSSDDSTAPEK